MRFYRLTTFVFPQSFRLRIFAICFVGTHLPLIAFLAWQTTAATPHWTLFALLLFATLIGTAAAMTGTGAPLADRDGDESPDEDRMQGASRTTRPRRI